MTNATPPQPPTFPQATTSASLSEISVDTVGTVRIGKAPDPAPYSAPLPISGGLLVFDSFAPDAPPYLQLDGYRVQDRGLLLILGEEAAEAVSAACAEAGLATVAAEDPDDHVLARRTTQWAPGPRHTPSARMATLIWLSQWSPEPLDPDLLDIEAGSLLGSLTEIIDEAREFAGDRLGRAAPRLVSLAANFLSERPLPGEAWVADLIADALEHAEDLLPDHPLHPEICRWADIGRRRDPRQRRLHEELDAELLQLLSAVQPVRGQTYQRGWHTADVDWAQVPPGMLDSGEETILWQINSSTLTVQVRGRASAPSDAPLAFRAYSPASPLPIALGQLAARPVRNGLIWQGMGPLRRDIPEADLVVDVYHPHYAGTPRIGPAAAQAKSERQAMRYLAQLREHIARQDSHGLTAWAEIVSADTAVHPDSPSSAAEGGSPGRPDVLTARMPALALAAREAAAYFGHRDHDGSDDAFDFAAPDAPRLCQPLWRPTLAEWGRMRRNFDH